MDMMVIPRNEIPFDVVVNLHMYQKAQQQLTNSNGSYVEYNLDNFIYNIDFWCLLISKGIDKSTILYYVIHKGLFRK